MIELKKDERLDDLQRKGYRIIQKKGGFCFGMDAVLLSAFAQIREGEEVLDLGTGTGIIPILLAGRGKGERFVGLEIQEDSVDMAQRSVCYNGLENRITIEQGDIKEASFLLGKDRFSVVVTNPPYMIGNHGLTNEGKALQIARHETLCTLEDILRESSKVLKQKGRFYMVHRPFRLPEIMCRMTEYGIEPKRMRLVHGRMEKEPSLLLIEGCKGGRPRLKIEPPLIIYEADGSYTKEVLRWYEEEA